MSLRVVIATRIPQVLAGFGEVVREAGHEVVAFLTIRYVEGWSDAPALTGELVMGAPKELDVLVPAHRSSIAPLLAAVEPDLVICMGLPWKVPPEALAVPRLGWLNGHPSLLPRHRGPLPVAWAIRAGDEELGITFHRMDAELDTGPILCQRPFPLGELEEPEAFYGRFAPVIVEALFEALQRLEAGDEGTPQGEGGGYESFFTADDVWLDLSRPTSQVHRLVWSWLYAMTPGATRGALLEVDDTPVRVLVSSLTEVEGARRIECADGPLWIVKTEELSEEEASSTSGPAPSTQ